VSWRALALRDSPAGDWRRRRRCWYCCRPGCLRWWSLWQFKEVMLELSAAIEVILECRGEHESPGNEGNCGTYTAGRKGSFEI